MSTLTIRLSQRTQMMSTSSLLNRLLRIRHFSFVRTISLNLCRET
jgi:hypothetical protein